MKTKYSVSEYPDKVYVISEGEKTGIIAIFYVIENSLTFEQATNTANALCKRLNENKK